MQSCRTSTACLIVGIALFATPSPTRAQTEAAESTVPLGETAVRAPGISGIQDPRLHGVTRTPSTAAENHHDRLFLALNTAFIVSASTDVSVSMYQIGRGVAREGGFGAQWQDSPMAFAVTKSATAAAFAYGVTRIHKTRPKTAIAIALAATAVEGWLAVRSARMSALHP